MWSSNHNNMIYTRKAVRYASKQGHSSLVSIQVTEHAITNLNEWHINV